MTLRLRLLPALLAVLVAAAPAGAVERSAATRVPNPPASGEAWEPAEAAALKADLDRLLDGAATLRGAHAGVLVETTDGRVLYERNADGAVQPASTMKLLTGSVALDRLGPDYRFVTRLVALPSTALPGVTELRLIGGADPLLAAADLRAAAAAAKEAGIAGAVSAVLDESRIAPGERRPPGWTMDDVLQDYAPVIDGFPFEENLLHARIVPGPVGSAPTVELPPPFVPQAVPIRACREGPTLLTFTIRARTAGSGTASTIDVEKGRCGDIVVTGVIPAGAPESLDVAVEQPELLALQTFTDALRRAGLDPRPGPPSFAVLPDVIAGPFTVAPPGRVLWRHEGEPLRDLLADLWWPSDNFVAEQLLREVDVVANARAGTAAGAAAIERTWLQRLGIDPATVTITDGSGLSQYNRLTPRALAAILLHDWSGEQRQVVLDDLPVAGVRGDLRGQMRGTPAEGRIFAKTGSMSHVRGLAGYAATRRHGTLIFVLSLDDWMGADAGLAELRAAFCSRLAGT